MKRLALLFTLVVAVLMLTPTGAFAKDKHRHDNHRDSRCYRGHSGHRYHGHYYGRRVSYGHSYYRPAYYGAYYSPYRTYYGGDTIRPATAVPPSESLGF